MFGSGNYLKFCHFRNLKDSSIIKFVLILKTSLDFPKNAKKKTYCLLEKIVKYLYHHPI